MLSFLGQYPEIWAEGTPIKNMEPYNGDPFSDLKKSVDEHDDELCKGWREELDSMLVFVRCAGERYAAHLNDCAYRPVSSPLSSLPLEWRR